MEAIEDISGQALRRAPSQKRSQERVERMLQAASALISEGGSDAMRMGEVAERAGVSIGSLYQYFPDKGAIIRTLAERYNAEGRACISDGLAGVGDMKGLIDAFGGLIDVYYGIFLAEPVMRDIWSGTQADKALRDIDLRDSRANGALLAEAWQRVAPASDAAEIKRKAFLIMSLGEATMRLAISVDRGEGDALVADYKAMALREIGARG
ncbi:TetR/AcrR family transcriptional regulator [Aminobacter carboxidus]|uniref:TetR family transcriptional regulator n=1 Tax=Aminobacter carboxidus TaxID=376165 RepID=A0ABR9GMI2_9HYPH|nr:TetR/AcrR family transcriptional regulator [Aminobacter carboxidus]MBE1204810.1 TetR family transcriptional regulator [Aminobacter carboxidus]